MSKTKRGIYIAIFVICLTLFMTSFTSAGILDWVKKTITGMDTSKESTVSVAVVGTNAVSILVFNQSLHDTIVDPTEKLAAYINFTVTVTDADGINDINDTSVNASFINGAVVRVNNSENNCTQISGETTATSQNYTCIVPLWYFDVPGSWTINVSATDLGNTTIMWNNSQAFSYDTLTAIEIMPSTLTWPSVSTGGLNVTSIQNTTVNNTGNYNVLANNVNVTGVDLHPASGEGFAVGNFTASITAGPVGCNSGNLTNGTANGITGATLSRGNLSLGGGSGQEVLYYCIPTIPSMLTSTTYSTSNSPSSPWTISIV